MNILSKLLVATALGFGTATAFAAEPEDAVHGAIDGQIAAFLAQDGERAFSFAAPNVKRFFPDSTAFMGMVRSGYQPVYAPRNYTFGRFANDGRRALQEVLVTGPKGKDWVALYTLEQQDDGTFLITGCQIRPSTAEAI